MIDQQNKKTGTYSNVIDFENGNYVDISNGYNEIKKLSEEQKSKIQQNLDASLKDEEFSIELDKIIEDGEIWSNFTYDEAVHICKMYDLWKKKCKKI